MHDDCLRPLLRSQFPTLPANRLDFLGEGWDFRAYAVDGQWIFRFPKSAESAARLELEMRVLEYVAPRVSLPVPDYRFRARPTADFPYLFAGYPRLPGESAACLGSPPTALAASLGEFLDRLHALDADDAAALGVETCDETAMSCAREGAQSDWAEVAALLDADLRQSCVHFLEDDRAVPPDYAGPLLLLHNDLGTEHTLVDPATGLAAGIIDWTDVSLGDPTIDFAGFYAWQGEPFLAAMLAQYRQPIDAHFADRVRYRAVYAALGGTYWGMKMDQPDACAPGARRLRRLLMR